MRHKKNLTRRFGLNFLLEEEIKLNCLFKSGVLTRHSSFGAIEIQCTKDYGLIQPFIYSFTNIKTIILNCGFSHKSDLNHLGIVKIKHF